MEIISAYTLGIASILMVVLPHVQALIQRRSWSARVKSRITVGLAVLAGIAGYLSQYGFDLDLDTLRDPARLLAWILAVYLGAAVIYARFLRFNGTTDWLEDHINTGKETTTEGDHTG